MHPSRIVPAHRLRALEAAAGVPKTRVRKPKTAAPKALVDKLQDAGS
jgi:hypothetical protein